MYRRKAPNIPESILKVVGDARQSGFDAKDLLEAIIQEWGGIRKFAGDIVSDMRSSGSNGLTKARYYEMINRLIIYVTSSSPPSEPVSEMDDAALLQATSEAVNNLMKKGALDQASDTKSKKAK